jgi:hypothetical protein
MIACGHEDMTVRDLRQRWPRAETRRQTEGEILITRDATPVAKRVRLVEPRTACPRLAPRTCAAWPARVGGRRVARRVDEFLAPDRNAR